MAEPSTAAAASPDPSAGRLRLPPAAPDGVSGPVGQRAVRVDGRPVGLLYVPPAGADRLVVLLHGAGAGAEHGLRLLIDEADERRLMLFAPGSVGRSWDIVEGGYGPDVSRIQRVLTEILTTYRTTEPMPAVGGFSDGASYALSLGLINGDVFDAVLAFSPGFAAPTSHAGSPACFVSHGTADRVLPVERCSRRIVAALRRGGYPVHYHEFDGGHEIPPDVVQEAMRWMSMLRAAQ